MVKLFEKKDASELRSIRIPILFTEKEKAQISHSASIRQMDVSEFIRRAALGRKADVDYETEIVLALSALRRSIDDMQTLHVAMIERGIQPLVDDWRPIKLAAREAIERITK